MKERVTTITHPARGTPSAGRVGSRIVKVEMAKAGEAKAQNMRRGDGEKGIEGDDVRVGLSKPRVAAAQNTHTRFSTVGGNPFSVLRCSRQHNLHIVRCPGARSTVSASAIPSRLSTTNAIVSRILHSHRQRKQLPTAKGHPNGGLARKRVEYPW
uniref:Uncharacterized protein n=1 Tax=Mycena chlorophos TaxID=658473 RepID=A0ABQ0L907_MYCCL|nr:predicted protein [Mycena chlorophos]